LCVVIKVDDKYIFHATASLLL